MAEIIEASAICESVSEPLGKGNLVQDSYGICEAEGVPLSKGTLVGLMRGFCENSSAIYGNLTKMILWTISTINSNKIRIIFDRGMLDDERLVDVLNYTITPTGGGVVLSLESIEKENKTNPTFVDIITSEMTNAQGYQCEIDTTEFGPVDSYGVRIDPANNINTFTGIGTRPTISKVIAIGENRVDVVFSESMADNEGIRNVLKYTFDKGLTVLDILDVEEDTVKLVTSDQAEGELYTLTITN